MKSLILIICSIFFVACGKNTPTITNREYKRLLSRAFSDRAFLPLLESSTITRFDVVMNKKLSDSILVGKNIFYINQPKSSYGMAQIIKITVDSISEIKKDMEIVYGSVPPRRSQIYGKFAIEYKKGKWEVDYVTSGIWDYR